MGEVILSLHCARCGEPSALSVYRESDNFDAFDVHTWLCPCCYRFNHLEMHGAILGVRAGSYT